MVGLEQNATAFFTLWLVTYLATLVLSSYFRTLATLTNSPESAIGAAGISVLAWVIHTGYVSPKPNIHPWTKWIAYINPLAYAFEALVANEFHDTLAPCASVVSPGPQYRNASAGNQVCAVTGSRSGQQVVSGDDYVRASFDYQYSHLWRNVGICARFYAASSSYLLWQRISKPPPHNILENTSSIEKDMSQNKQEATQDRKSG